MSGAAGGSLTGGSLAGGSLAGATVLVIEDEPSIVQLVRLYLEEAGARVLAALDGLSGLEAFERERPDLVILDLMLPRRSGWDVCVRIRQAGDTPIIMLTARDTEDDRVRGLDLGADDYVTKPFSPRELVSRARAVLRRKAPTAPSAPEEAERLEFAGLLILPRQRRVELDGRSIELTAKEFDLLLALARAPGQAYGRQTLFLRVWGFDYLGDSRTVDVHIGTLRKKIEREPDGWRYIHTLRGVGYRFEPTHPAPRTRTDE